MNIALDIDDTITAKPQLFSYLSNAVSEDKGKVIIISTRTNNPEALELTKKELSGYGIRYDKIYLLDDSNVANEICPHKDLDWYNKYLWQKVHLCKQENIEVVFEDDTKVIDLFQRYAPEVQIIQIVKCNV